jgi:hypothetical protein
VSQEDDPDPQDRCRTAQLPGLSRDGAYHVAGEAHSSADMIERYAAMLDAYPVWSIEDGLAEGDWDGRKTRTDRPGDRLQIVGDDMFVTNPAIIAEAIEKKTQPDRLDLRDSRGDAPVPGGRLPADGLPPLR